MKCTRCGFDNPDYLEYCQNCTAPLDNKRGGDEKEPAWGFVKAPKWAKPEFSADTVSDSDVPSDFVQQGKKAGKAAEAAASAVTAAAASAVNRAEEAVTQAPYETADMIEDELDELEDDFEEFEDDVESGAKHASPFAFLGRFKKNKKPREYDEYDDGRIDDEFEDEELQDLDEFDDEYEDDSDYDYKPKRTGNRDLTPIIKIVGVIAALAVLAVAIWLIAKAASGCSKPREFDPPVVEQSIDNPNVYFVTVYAEEGTKVVYETAKNDRTEVYTIPEACLAKFKVPVAGLLPGEPVEGDTYYATPKVFILNDDGTETPVEIDPIPLSIPSLELTFDNESDNITTSDGKAVISGHITYINADLTIDGEPVSIASDGAFKKEFSFEEPGTHTVLVEAKLPNYQIARRTFNITVEEAVITNPDAMIQMPWDYGDASFKQRVVNSVESIDVRGKVPEGSTVTVSSESANATLTTPTVDPDGTFHFTITMKVAGDYTVTVNCTTQQGNSYSRDIHLQRQPDYSPYIQNAWAMDYAAFSFGNSQQYKIEGKVTEILHDGDYYLAKFELTDGHTIVIEYHPHYGSGRDIAVGDTFSQVYGRSLGFGDDGNIRFYVWFIND